MSDNGGFDRPPMPLVGNSQLLAGCAGMWTGVLPAPPNVNTIGSTQDLATWETREAEAQELELLVFPVTAKHGSPYPNDAALLFKVHLYLTVGLGASGAPGASYNVTMSLPMNGIRYRFRGKRARLSAANVAYAQTAQAQIFAAIYPVAGDSEMCSGLDFLSSFVQIPKGARAFRCSVGPLETAGVVRFGDFNQEVSGADLVSIPVASCLDWTDIPHGAYNVFANASSSFDAKYGTTVWFRN